jgi:hypothetical protein
MSLFPLQDFSDGAVSLLTSSARFRRSQKVASLCASSIVRSLFAACWFVACSGLAIRADVFPYGLGANGLGQVGDGALLDRSSPVAIVSGDRPVAVQLTAVSAGGGGRREGRDGDGGAGDADAGVAAGLGLGDGVGGGGGVDGGVEVGDPGADGGGGHGGAGGGEALDVD